MGFKNQLYKWACSEPVKTPKKLNELVALGCWLLQAVVTEQIICSSLLKFKAMLLKEVS